MLVDFDLRIAISDFRVIFLSDSFTVAVDNIMIFLFNSL